MLNQKYKYAPPAAFFLLALMFAVFVFLPSLKSVNTDFPNYYVSSKMLIDGVDLKKAYDNVEFNRQLLLYGIENEIVSFVPYPPVNALLMLPLAGLQPLNAKFIWNLLNVIFLLFSVIIISRLAGLNFYYTGIIFFLSGFALANNFFFAQAYLLVLFLLALSFYFRSKKMEGLEALFLALSIVLKFYTVFFLLLYLFRKQYRLVLNTVIFSLLLYIPVIMITGFGLNVYYYTELMPRLSDGWVGMVYSVEYQSFISVLHRLFDREPSLNPNPLIVSPLLFYIFKYLYIFMVTGVSLYYIKNIKPQNENLALSLFCIVCLLLLPLNASYQFTVLIPAVVFICSHYLKSLNYRAAGLTVLTLLFINSPPQVWFTGFVKNTPLLFLGYVKLYGLLFLWVLNLRLLSNHGAVETKKILFTRYLPVSAVAAVIFTVISLLSYTKINDGAEPVIISSNFLVSMPSALNSRQDKLVYTECVNGKFVLRSDFGFSYDEENIFNPLFINKDITAYETVQEKVRFCRLIDLESGSIVTTARETTGTGAVFSKNGNWKSYINEGQLFLEDLSSGKTIQLTRGRQICSYPVFAGDDSKIIFCSDRNRGVGFTALYMFDINKITAPAK